MPDSLMTLFPQVLNNLELMKLPVRLTADLAAAAIRSHELVLGLAKNNSQLGTQWLKSFLPFVTPDQSKSFSSLLDLFQESSSNFLSAFEKNVTGYLKVFHQERLGELEFLNLFTQKLPP